MISSVALSTGFAAPRTAWPCATVEDCAKTPLYMIPGPYPVVAPAPSGWSDKECEMAGGVFRGDDTEYLMVYHCTSDTSGYNVGISTATDPLGPWSPPAEQPVLKTNASSWDADDVASFNLMRNPKPTGAHDAWLGWYEGGYGAGVDKWSLGLATAPHPTGPWAKHAANPILKGEAVCDAAKEFDGVCNGLYLGSAIKE